MPIEIPRSNKKTRSIVSRVIDKIIREVHSVLAKYIPGYYTLCLIFRFNVRKNMLIVNPDKINSVVFNHENFDLYSTYGISLDGDWDLQPAKIGKSFAPGAQQEGGDGVTIIYFE